jgi:hypothetical protein
MAKKAKWKVEAKYETKEELYKFYKEKGADPEYCDIGDFNNVEISVVREDNKHGIKSYGWGDLDKIVLFDRSDDYTKKDIEWCKQVAETICEVLNRKGL